MRDFLSVRCVIRGELAKLRGRSPARLPTMSGQLGLSTEGGLHREAIGSRGTAVLRGRRTLVVDDVWGSGRTITSVKIRVSAAGGFPFTCVLHFNPYRNLFGSARPDYYAAITDAHIVYPWEIDRDVDRMLLE